MGLPLPTGVLYKVQHNQWPDENDWSNLSDQQRMDRQWKAYKGLFKPPLRRLDPNEPDHNVIDNRCEPIVTAGVDMLYGDEVKFEVSNDDDSPDEQAQTYLDAVWDANHKMPLLAEYEINSAVFGHGFFKLDPDDPDTDPYPAISILNPQQMTMRTLPYDVRKVTRYAFTFQDENEQGDVVMRRELWMRNRVGATDRGFGQGGWVIQAQELAQGSGLSTLNFMANNTLEMAQNAADSHWVDIAPAQTWDYPWAPVHDAKNMPEPNSVWGKADLRLDLIHLNEVLNFLLSNRQRILYYHGHPKDIFFGVHYRALEDSPGDSLCIPNTAARVEHIEMGGDLGAINAAIDDIRESMDELSHVPGVATGRIKNLPAVPSGVALKVVERPQVAQTLQKRNLRNALFIRLCQHILELGGFGSARKVTVQWPDMLPIDDLASAQEAVLWQQIGASTDSLLQRASPPFDPDVERKKKLDEAKAEIAVQKMRLRALPPPPPPAPVAAPANSTSSSDSSGESESGKGEPMMPMMSGKKPPSNSRTKKASQ